MKIISKDYFSTPKTYTLTEMVENPLKMLFWICFAHYLFGFWLGVAASNYLGWVGVAMFFASLVFYIVVMYKYLIKIISLLK